MHKIIGVISLCSLILSTQSGVVTPFAMQVDIYASKNPGIFCWKRSYGRGVGTIPTGCGSKQNDAGLCYTNCKDGYSGSGPLCLTKCKKGYKNHPLSCYKNLISWYWKSSYGRGVGTIPSDCGSKQNDAGLCYNKCKDGYYGVGPVCWKGCTTSAPVNCGAACASSQDTCASKILEQIVSVLEVAENVVEIVATAGGAAALKASAKVAMQAMFNAAKKAIAKGATKEAFIKLMRAVALKSGSFFAEAAAKKCYVRAASNSAFDWNDFAALDPTGIANVVIAFTNDVC
jgi:hypothetical protein